VAFIGFLLVPLVYIGAMIQAYIAAKNLNEHAQQSGEVLGAAACSVDPQELPCTGAV
jgi:hypothetical protein